MVVPEEADWGPAKEVGKEEEVEVEEEEEEEAAAEARSWSMV